MAADAIDHAARDLPGPVAPSCSAEQPLLGADGYQARWNARARLAHEHGLPPAQLERLLDRYGACVDELLAPLASQPELARLLPGSGGYLAAEIRYACTHEGALHLEDVLARRTRIAIETRDRGAGAAEPAARLMAAALGWDETRRAREVEAFRDRVAAEAAALATDDDAAASAARLAAPEIVPTGLRSLAGAAP
jgi:glycerol-3-phosphate dehydrogenase